MLSPRPGWVSRPAGSLPPATQSPTARPPGHYEPVTARPKYGTGIEELGRSTQYTVPVVVQRSRILRTRAKFDIPWFCTFEVDVDDEQIDQSHLLEWLDIAGRQIGVGDWRPEKSGMFGRFSASDIEKSRKGRGTARFGWDWLGWACYGVAGHGNRGLARCGLARYGKAGLE